MGYVPDVWHVQERGKSWLISPKVKDALQNQLVPRGKILRKTKMFMTSPMKLLNIWANTRRKIEKMLGSWTPDVQFCIFRLSVLPNAGAKIGNWVQISGHQKGETDWFSRMLLGTRCCKMHKLASWSLFATFENDFVE